TVNSGQFQLGTRRISDQAASWLDARTGRATMSPAEPQQTPQHVTLSIASTLYCSKKYIREFCTRSAAVAERLVGHDYEIVLVNDGSPDESLDMAIDLARDN